MAEKSTDTIFAELTDRLSGACVRFPNTLGRFMMGDIVTKWHYTNTDARLIESWVPVGGVRTSGNRPATYTHAAVLQTNFPSLAEYLRFDSSTYRLAAAYCIGNYVMAADIGDDIRAVDQEDSSLEPVLQAGLRVGRGDMQATLGVRNRDDNTFIGADENVALVSEPAKIAEIRAQYPGAYML